MTFYIELGTTQVTNPQLAQIVAAINQQMSGDFCPAFGLNPVTWEILVAGTSTSPGDLVITVMDQDQSVANALGYHSEQANGVKFGSVMVDPIFQALGSDPLVSVAQVLSHECCESVADPACDQWALGTDNRLWAFEVCDPVQSSTYTVGAVTVSDFVYPAFFDDQPPSGSKFDHLSVLQSGFQVAKGGYAVVWATSTAQPSQIFGTDPPEWKLSKAVLYRPFGRTQRRLSAGTASR